jgi:hypothetical protein
MPDLHCPFCESRTNFTDVWRFQSVPIGAVQRGWNGQIMEALQCDNSQCQMIIGGILATDGLIHDYWPRSFGGKAFPDVPEQIGAAANEAPWHCLRARRVPPSPWPAPFSRRPQKIRAS